MWVLFIIAVQLNGHAIVSPPLGPFLGHPACVAGGDAVARNIKGDVEIFTVCTQFPVTGKKPT